MSNPPPDRPAPHRGPVILSLAAVSFIVAPLVVAPVAWLLARQDLQKMAAGRMDPAGRDQTRLGHRLAVVSFVLWSCLLTCCCGTSVTVQLWRGSRWVAALGSRRISEDEFNRVQPGMTEQQVQALIGRPARQEYEPYHHRCYWYERGGNKTFEVDFTTAGQVQGMGASWPD